MVTCLLAVNCSLAQDSITTKKSWHFLIEPYVMFPNLNGTVSISDLPDVGIDEDAGSIFVRLQMGAMIYAEMQNAKWAISTDLMYMNLEAVVTGKHEVLTGNAVVKQLAGELALLRRIRSWLEAGIAFQLNSIETKLRLELDSSPPSAKQGTLSETWLDPSFITRIRIPVNRWLLQFRGNIGGVGVGSNFYWQAQAYAGYRLSKLFLLSIGYRAIAMDYENGSGRNYFLYDIATFGPVVRFGFNL